MRILHFKFTVNITHQTIFSRFIDQLMCNASKPEVATWNRNRKSHGFGQYHIQNRHFKRKP